MASGMEERVRAICAPLIESMGLTLWGVRFHGGSRPTLQIFIDREGGVSADDCGEVVDALSPALDAADPIAAAYNLEVSSPGLDRFLFTLEQAQAAVGEEVRAELAIPTAGRKRLSGTLSAAGEDGMLTITERAGGDFPVMFGNIATLRVIPHLGQGAQPVGTQEGEE
ncbi:MAG: ribosome maturation factor RimP [Succinivibrionaceae bacterium]|nr:ribosome maturation factor RimP [Succinivibrionaceae bacterium]